MSAPNCGVEDHCCWFQGEQCRYVRQSDQPGRAWVCSLRSKYGDWAIVHLSPEYQLNVKHRLVDVGYEDIDCGDWPPPGIACHTCGANVNG